jgi:hypothetical protein
METQPNIHMPLSIVELFPFNQRLIANRIIKNTDEVLPMNLASLDFSI